ncbi:MAG: peptidase T [Chitinophagaceae bacterium]|jgi:tripeptide aminopeptidase|nr:peptidase T [Chitinophagaceae bacterium]MBP6987808.1 peptidase T [Ferruginibacter sp.]MBK7087932.1 peptidase T [Chitinophagaceae bacterium]MBK7346686.1 peptidase T [Chitinophagaceae bacterium]MBK7735396.1 peptidase T [Chitinophagaceae bacterium]
MTHYINGDSLAERFMRYVRIDTQSDPESNSTPSTEKQKELSQLLFMELRGLGLTQVETDEYGYVYATIPSNTGKKNVPAICYCAHVDTAPDCSGTNVKPILHSYYNGDDIVLPDDASQVLSISNSPYLKTQIGNNIITASGNTLLGADDKSGVAVIMETISFLLQNPTIKHGAIKIVFTPDEEVGKGTAKIDMQKVGASFGYTLDGGEAGCLEEETFSADAATITVNGVIAHPGNGKNKLVNAIKIAGEILETLPKTEWSPETTEKMQGFVHPVSVNGISEKASISFIVRDFDTETLARHHARLKKIAEEVVAKHKGATLQYLSHEQYRNMKDVLKEHPQVVEYAMEAIKRSGLEVKMESIRGGTDGSKLSFLGMPCPNIFTGMQNIHSKLEWVSVKDMAKAAETLVHLAQVWEEKN